MEAAKDFRQIAEIQRIAEYLSGMKFRKRLVGGVDEDSVLEHFSAVTLQYEAIISAYMQQADANARRLAEAQSILQGNQAPQPAAPQPQQWYGGAQAFPPAPQPMQQPYGQNPWAQQQPYGHNAWPQQAPPYAAENQPPPYMYG